MVKKTLAVISTWHGIKVLIYVCIMRINSCCQTRNDCCVCQKQSFPSCEEYDAKYLPSCEKERAVIDELCACIV